MHKFSPLLQVLIDVADKNTHLVFGDYGSVYDIQRAVEDGATVPIYYERRLAKLELKEEERPHLNEAFDELTEGEEWPWLAVHGYVSAEDRVLGRSAWAFLSALVVSKRNEPRLVASLKAGEEERDRWWDEEQHFPAEDPVTALATLQSLVAQRETETLELKRSTAEPTRAGERLCAFLTGEGGKVLIGVGPDAELAVQRAPCTLRVAP